MGDQLTLDEAAAILDRYAVDDEADKAAKKRQKVKDLILEGDKDQKDSLNRAADHQMKLLNESDSSYVPPKKNGNGYAPSKKIGSPTNPDGAGTR